jgi:hypothetical protein
MDNIYANCVGFRVSRDNVILELGCGFDKVTPEYTKRIILPVALIDCMIKNLNELKEIAVNFPEDTVDCGKEQES